MNIPPDANELELIARALVANRGHGLPNKGDTVLIEGTGVPDAIHIQRIVSVAEPTRCRGGMWQASMVVEGKVIRQVAVEDCASEYRFTAKLI